MDWKITDCTDGDGQPITGLRSLVGKRVHLLFEFPVQKARVIAVDGDWLICRHENGRTILLNAQYAGSIHIVEDAMP